MADVSTIAYHVLYEVLLEKLYSDIKGLDKIAVSKYSPQVWSWTVQGKIVLLEKIPNLKSTDYFYKTRSTFKIYPEAERHLNDSYLIATLKYLGYVETFPNEFKNVPPKIKAETLFARFNEDYAEVIALIRADKTKVKKNRLTNEAVDRILKKSIVSQTEIRLQTDRFYKLNGTFIGKQIQGKHRPEPITFVLRTLDKNNVEGEVTVYYKADGYNDDGEAIYPVAGKFLNDNYLALSYWNPDQSILQSGVIYLKFSGDCRKLEGYFIGVYDPPSEARTSNTFKNEFINWKEQVSGVLLDLEKTEKSPRNSGMSSI